jgi:hypothetical protein
MTLKSTPYTTNVIMHYGHDDSGSIEVDETYLGGKEEGLRGRK